MAIELDDEILQDFLVEAGEIIEQLGEQLVELEQSPHDLDLLNAIFRGFHTVKGGAGFLAIHSLVEICHSAEDVFNVLRQGSRHVTPDLMDVILQVLDIVNAMFNEVRSGNLPEEAPSEILQRLKSYATPADTSPPTSQPLKTSPPIPEVSSQQDIVAREFESMLDGSRPDEMTALADTDSDEISEQEFEDLLDALHGKGGSPTASKATPKETNHDDISEDEFESLLDDLHGKGKFNGAILTPDAITKSVDPVKPDEITDDEFERLLDDLHGKGKFDGNIAVTTADTKTNPSTIKKDEPKLTAQPSPNSEEFLAANPTDEPVATFTKTTKIEPAADKSKAPQAQADTTVRVDTQILDDIMNMVGELVLVRNRFQTLKASNEANEQLSKAISNLDVVTADLQLAVMKTRMQPIKKVFGRFPRVVRDLARSLKKEIRLELVGEETDLDKNLVEALADPLVHLVRNAVDHGIESPQEREAHGKPREGLVILKASQEGDHIQLSIQDDGKGMNPNVLRSKVVEKGLMDEESAARLDDKECYNLIFLPGFSTKAEISDVSGRGVGMDVVKTRIAQMNGIVEIDSIEGKGSTIIIKVPLTLAIMPTLMVKLGGQAFALPLASVLEILDLDLTKTNKVDNQLVVMVRNKALPLFYLSEWLVKDPDYVLNKKTTSSHVVVVNAGGRQAGFVVDQLIGQEEVVIKALGAKLHGLEGLAGATITGDGKIALILDVPGLMKKYVN